MKLHHVSAIALLTLHEAIERTERNTKCGPATIFVPVVRFSR